jgi:limonene-1,2-epoxide hydrolase
VNAVEVVRGYWECMQARDWAAAGALLAEDVRVEWPVTRELIVGRAAVVAVNADYPEGWEIRVLRVLDAGESVVAEVAVPQGGVEHRAVGFYTVRDDRVTTGREYWSVFGGEQPPTWRGAYTQRF